jgi:hypothetical protein
MEKPTKPDTRMRYNRETSLLCRCARPAPRAIATDDSVTLVRHLNTREPVSAGSCRQVLERVAADKTSRQGIDRLVGNLEYLGRDITAKCDQKSGVREYLGGNCRGWFCARTPSEVARGSTRD